MSKFASFVRTRNTVPTADEIKNAQIVTDVKMLLSITTLQDKYNFVGNNDLAKALTTEMRKAEKAEIIVCEYQNGEPYNKVITSDKNGNNRQQWIVFGNKGDCSPARELTADEIKNLVAGICEQSGIVITDTMEQAGKLYKVPRKYCKLS